MPDVADGGKSGGADEGMGSYNLDTVLLYVYYGMNRRCGCPESHMLPIVGRDDKFQGSRGCPSRDKN